MGIMDGLGYNDAGCWSSVSPGHGNHRHPMGLPKYPIWDWDRYAFYGPDPSHPSCHRVRIFLPLFRRRLDCTQPVRILLTTIRPELNGQAAGFFSFIRIFGQALGVAISGVIFQNSLKGNLLRIPGFASLADEYSRDATIIVGVIKQMEDGDTKTRVIQAYSDSLKALWLALLAFSAIGLILSMTVKGYSMTQEHVTKQHLVQEEKSKDGNVESGGAGGAMMEK